MSRESRPEREAAGCFVLLKRLFSCKDKERKGWEEAAEQRRRRAARRTPAPRMQLPPFQDVAQVSPGEEQRPVRESAVTSPEREVRRKPAPLRAPAGVVTHQPTIRTVPTRPLPPLPTTQAYRGREVYGNAVPSRSTRTAARQQPLPRATPAYKHRPLPALPTDQGQPTEATPTKRPPRPSAHMSRSTPDKDSPGSRKSRAAVLDMELPPPKHGSSSSLFPAPLNLKKSAPGPSVRRSLGLDSLIRKPSIPTRAEPPNTNGAVSGEHNSFGRKVSAGQCEPLNLDTISVVSGRGPKEGHFSRARPVSLNINNLVVGDRRVPEKGLAERLPLTPRDANNLADNKGHGQAAQEWGKDLSAPLPPLPLNPTKTISPPPYTPQREPPLPRRSASVTLRHNTPMQPTAARAVVTWLRDNLAHVPYAVTSLSALAMWGFPHHLPTHVSILCPEHCRDVITSWAVATGVVLYPRQRGFGLRLGGEEAVRRVRVRFVPAEDFARLRTVGRGRVLGLASLVDVLAGEFMDMEGERAGEKRVVLGGGISWAVERMVKMGASVGGGEVRNVGNPLFLEPFVCTFPGSRELFVEAGLIGSTEPRKQRSWLGLTKGGAGKGVR